MIVFFFLVSIKWQALYMPINDSLFNMKVLIEIPSERLRFVIRDSIQIASYETQLLIFDKRGEQIAGDFWFREVEKNETIFHDSLNLIIPRTASKFNLRVIDLYGQGILNVSDRIALLNLIANIHSEFSNDSLIVIFTVLNTRYPLVDLDVSFRGMNRHKSLRAGVYEDTLIFPVAQVTNGIYEMKFVISEGNQLIETLLLPIEIARPFYLDETAWQLKVTQLEYIATPAELAMLRKAVKEERDSLWRTFWRQYDPTPNTPYNEKENEYFERIAYAQEHFSFGDKGWRSDRGRIYVKFGPPDEIQSRPYELSTKPYEIWYYYRLNLKFIFYDRHGFGEYILMNPQGERI